jgi:hypothetical protein
MSEEKLYDFLRIFSKISILVIKSGTFNIFKKYNIKV